VRKREERGKEGETQRERENESEKREIHNMCDII
jgi:hypothetical protein